MTTQDFIDRENKYETKVINGRVIPIKTPLNGKLFPIKIKIKDIIITVILHLLLYSYANFIF